MGQKSFGCGQDSSAFRGVEVVSAGIGVALVPASTQKIGLAGVAYRQLREATPHARTAVAWRRADSSPVITAFLDVARRVAKQVNSGPAQ